ncbi:MAG: PilZ domain-containing protein [Candidatus Desulfofervidus auxilii]|nr:PilZ domain-containing protein [Candidatus Desulfofervidus auxilii]
MQEERRDYVRIDDCLAFDYKILTPEEYEKEKEIFLKQPSAVEKVKFKYPFLPLSFTGERKKESELKIQTTEQMLFGLLVNLNEKIDTILHLLGHKEKEKTNLRLKPLSYVNISGAGMRFITEEKMKPGDFLKIDILLPLFPSFIITVLAEIKRVKEISTKEYETAVSFKHMHEEDREALIYYIFMRQRKLIRMCKEENVKDEQILIQTDNK